MKSFHSLTCVILLISVIRAGAQDTLIKTVLENNRELRTARESYHTSILEAGTGILPPDPEIEFGYLFGNPDLIGNRVDFTVKQHLDFPTTYLHKSRLKRIKTGRAELEYLMARQEILLLAKQLWIERIYLTQKEQLLVKRVEHAKEIHLQFLEQLEAGEVGLLQFGQSNLQLAALQGEYEQVQSNLRQNQLSIHEICGGVEWELSDTVFPAPLALHPDSIFIAYRESPEMNLRHSNKEIKVEQKNMTVSQNLPKFSAGYYSESVLDQNFKGFQVGLSVPLWENSNRIKQAKSEMVFAETDLERFIHAQDKEIKQKLEQLTSLEKRINHLEEALNLVNEPELLSQALNSGEITLSDYFYGSDFYFRNQQLLLRYKMERLMIEADLMKVYL